jgi:hypothetical protein
MTFHYKCQHVFFSLDQLIIERHLQSSFDLVSIYTNEKMSA